MSLCAALTVGGCGDSDPPRAAVPEPYASMYASLCDAHQLASVGDASGARTAFVDGAHGPLHQLAADVSEEDRGVAAQLLESKEATEQSMQAQDSTPVAKALSALISATRKSITLAHGRAPEPCEDP